MQLPPFPGSHFWTTGKTRRTNVKVTNAATPQTEMTAPIRVMEMRLLVRAGIVIAPRPVGADSC
ncbi:MAG: hypothetical protein ABI361_02015 [Nitrososphaera sp.]